MIEDDGIAWDHPSRMIATFVLTTTASVEQARAALQRAAAGHRYWDARGMNALTDLRLGGEVGLYSFTLAATPYLMPHIRPRMPKVSIEGDIRQTETGAEISVRTICSAKGTGGETRAQAARDVRAFLRTILDEATTVSTSRDIR